MQSDQAPRTERTERADHTEHKQRARARKRVAAPSKHRTRSKRSLREEIDNYHTNQAQDHKSA